MIEQITFNQEILSIIIRSDYNNPGVNFLTPHSFSQQLAFMNHPQGKIIPPHMHNRVSREVDFTQEVLVIRKGKLQVDFYSTEKVYLESRILHQGDVILLAKGGHGFKVLEDLEMIEVKQGPYLGENDKLRFTCHQSPSLPINL